MKMSTRMCYGTRALLELARHYDQGALSLAKISQCQDLPMKYLEQLMPPLKAGGFVRAQRGARGGYSLTARPDQVAMDAVFRCLEGTVTTTECVQQGDLCNRSPCCPVRPLWTEVHEAIMQTLADVTLQDLLERTPASSSRVSA